MSKIAGIGLAAAAFCLVGAENASALGGYDCLSYQDKTYTNRCMVRLRISACHLAYVDSKGRERESNCDLGREYSDPRRSQFIYSVVIDPLDTHRVNYQGQPVVFVCPWPQKRKKVAPFEHVCER